MKRNSYIVSALLLVGLALSSIASANQLDCPGYTPGPNAAYVATRVFNDCPTSVLTVVNSYPAMISFDDQNLTCFGGANLDSWVFSTDAGATRAQFQNCSEYHFCADVTLSGTGPAEAGLRIAPWWSPDVDGRFMINKGGEIACFSGRLPFYSFTVAYGIHYAPGVVAHMEMTYLANGLSTGSPATVEYRISLGGGPTYTSGPVPFDQGNVSEAPLHGMWGALFPHYVGGYFQHSPDNSGDPVGATASFANICFDFQTSTATKTSTWGRVKTLYR
jgi:hypothetical protein